MIVDLKSQELLGALLPQVWEDAENRTLELANGDAAASLAVDALNSKLGCLKFKQTQPQTMFSCDRDW